MSNKNYNIGLLERVRNENKCTMMMCEDSISTHSKQYLDETTGIMYKHTMEHHHAVNYGYDKEYLYVNGKLIKEI
jgi:hypothetical protein